MSVDYSFNLAVGFIVEMENLLKPFVQERPEKFHMEDRFDPKTGQKTGQEKVIDQHTEKGYIYDGESYDERYDLLEALSAKLECSINNGGGHSDCKTAYISVDFETDDSGEDYGRVCVGGKATLEEVSTCKAKCIALKKALNKLGVAGIGEAMVYVSPNIS